MNRYIIQVILLTLVLFGFFFQASCKRSTDEQRSPSQKVTEEEIKLKVGYLPINPALPLFVAFDNGLFDEQNILVVPVKYQNGALMAEDVIAGRLAAACPGPADVYLSREAVSPGQFKIYLQTAYTPKNFIYSILVRKDSGIVTAQPT